jgi:hypothetical protein
MNLKANMTNEAGFNLAEYEATCTVQPFSSGSQFAEWEDRNCGRCVKSASNTWDQVSTPCPVYQCVIDELLGLACINDGKVPDEIAERSGYLANQGKYTWDCPERELVAK